MKTASSKVVTCTRHNTFITDILPCPSSSPLLPRSCCRWRGANTCCTSRAPRSPLPSSLSPGRFAPAAPREHRLVSFWHCPHRASWADFCALSLQEKALGKRIQRQYSFHGLVYGTRWSLEFPQLPTSSKFHHSPGKSLSIKDMCLLVSI